MSTQNITQETKNVSRALFESYLVDGGATATLEGKSPLSGFCVAPSKDTEEMIASPYFNELRLAQYIEEHKEELSLEGNHVGIWEDKGIVYIDIVKVLKNKELALRVARNSEQLAVFDLSTCSTLWV